MNAVPLLLATDLANGRFSALRERLADAQTEAVTGRAADPARAVNGAIGRLQRLEGAVRYADERAGALAFAGERAAITQTALGQIRDETGDVRVALLAAQSRNEATDLPVIGTMATAAFEDAVSRLNTGFGERPLFAGNETGQTPLIEAADLLDAVRAVAAAAPDAATGLADIEAWFNDPAGGFETAAYRGGTGEAPATELAPGTRVHSTVRADDSALRDTLRALAVTVIASEAGDAGSRETYTNAAADQTAGAVNAVNTLAARLGVAEQRFAEARTGYEAQSVTLSFAVNALTAKDQAEAATRMLDIENQLQAAYATTSRLAGLSLVNYLR